jgi:hypothetical protein
MLGAFFVVITRRKVYNRNDPPAGLLTIGLDAKAIRLLDGFGR